MRALGHLKTITHHKLLVMRYCFRVGLIRQGLLHDLSKYSWTEFRIGAKYYSGTHSPNASEREELGYSTAWLHHKGRNKHHLEYWMDYGGPDLMLKGQPMPTKYMVELCLDRISACRVYHGKAYTDRDPLNYLNRSLDVNLMHPITRNQVAELLTMLAEKGEKETLRYIRTVVLRNPVKYYPNLPVKDEASPEKDAAFVPADVLAQIASEHPTPFYLYSEKEIQSRCGILRDAFSWCPGWQQFFPMKAAPTPGILRLLRNNGQGVVCSSRAELLLCSRCGFQPDEILFMSNYSTDADIRTAGELGCRSILDGPGLVSKFANAGLLKEGIGLRLNPGGVFRFGTSEARLDQVKFGFTPDQAKACILELQERGIRSVGLHCYLSGNTLDPAYYPAVLRKLIEHAMALSRDTGIAISYLNISGGLGIPYRPSDTPLDLSEIGNRVREVYEAETRDTPLAGVPVFTEVGRWLTGPAGLLVTRVTQIREGFRSIAGVDASASDLMRPMMYGAYHHVSVSGRAPDAPRKKWDVVGTVCENTDKFAEQRLLPDMKPGDLLLIHDAGAHGHSMGYQYGGRLRCAEYLLDQAGGVTELRRAETPEDYFSTLDF